MDDSRVTVTGAYLGSSSAAAQVSKSGSLRTGRSSSSTPKICQKGFCPEYGLGGNITLSTAKKVMSEGCDEGYEHWDKMKGLLKIVLHLIENLLDLGESKLEGNNLLLHDSLYELDVTIEMSTRG
ncbi:hypothetical protein EVAR_13830_1 [Eumeta japonica]|uniref:Uncharacterized protein n=1 Tax=Eumeta variegata TaxID=151549 RepID=A0A4C1U1E2_EUMVA|nr:hypothetical protein EVAR_13830_1 [Eumeta japonica]